MEKNIFVLFEFEVSITFKKKIWWRFLKIEGKKKLEKFIEKNILFEFKLSIIFKKRTWFLKIKGEKELEKNVFVLFESHPKSWSIIFKKI